MPTLRQRIDDLTRTQRPVGHGEVDPVTGIPKAARGKLPSYLTKILVSQQTAGDVSPQTGKANLPGAPDPQDVTNAGLRADPGQLVAAALKRKKDEEEKARPRGQSANILAGSTLLGTPSLAKKTLIGY